MPASSPSTTLYTLGRGILYVGSWTGATPPVAVTTDVGNCPKFDVEVTEEKLDHFSSRTGIKTKDKTVTLQAGYTLAFDLDEISMYNLAQYLRGTLVTASQISAMTALDAEYALKFVANNPAGPSETWHFYRVRLTPGGAFSLIADEWTKMSFSGEGLSDVANHATSPYFTVDLSSSSSSCRSSSSSSIAV